MRGDPLQLGGDHAQVLRPLRDVDLADVLRRQHVRELARHRRHVVGLRRDRRVLRVGQRLGELLVAAVQVADHRVHADNRFALEREDGAEHPVGRGVLRPHVHGEALAARVLEVDLRRRSSADHPSTPRFACVFGMTPSEVEGSSVGRVRRVHRVGLQEGMSLPVIGQQDAPQSRGVLRTGCRTCRSTRAPSSRRRGRPASATAHAETPGPRRRLHRHRHAVVQVVHPGDDLESLLLPVDRGQEREEPAAERVLGELREGHPLVGRNR